MGCMSSVPHDVDRSSPPPEVNRNPRRSLSFQAAPPPPAAPPPNAQNANDNMASGNIDAAEWTTDDVITFICSIEQGKFCEPKYDMFKAGLSSLGINGQTMAMYVSAPDILRD